MLTIGLTGGIGSGKTAVSDRFKGLGAGIIDTDLLSRKLVEPGQPALEAIHRRFGADCLTRDGFLNRKALRRHVFDDVQARKDLEAILHPGIYRAVEEQLSTLQTPYAIVVVPLLTENTGQSRYHRVLVVDCPESLQIQRVMARDQCSEQQAKAILAAQVSRQQRLTIADDIIDNSGSTEALEKQVRELHQRYLDMAPAFASHVR